MYITEIILVAFALSIDAFSAAICQGLKIKNLKLSQAFIIAFLYGAFTALMPTIGYLIVVFCENSGLFQSIVQNFAGLIAFLMLFILGGKNLIDTLRGYNKTENINCNKDTVTKINYVEVILTAIAVSIDALMTGFAYALMQANMFVVIPIIAFVTFALSFIGVYFGNFFGSRWERHANITASIVLMLLGIKFLLEFIGVL